VNDSVAVAPRLIPVPARLASPAIETTELEVVSIKAAETSDSDAAPLTAVSVVVESSYTVVPAVALKVKEPKFAEPGAAKTIAPLVAVIVKTPVTENESEAESVKLKLAAVMFAAPVTVTEAPPPTASVTAPVAASVSVPAVLVPTMSVAESS
jgi:hypothetical protein